MDNEKYFKIRKQTYISFIITGIPIALLQYNILSANHIMDPLEFIVIFIPTAILTIIFSLSGIIGTIRICDDIFLWMSTILTLALYSLQICYFKGMVNHKIINYFARVYVLLVIIVIPLVSYITNSIKEKRRKDLINLINS